MTSGHRPIMYDDGTVLTGSMHTAEEDYTETAFHKLVLGVVLDVYPSDHRDNRSSQQTLDRHGHTHECTVLVVNEGSSSYMVLPNVIITPEAPIGLDDYQEKLPRPSRNTVDGTVLDATLRNIDPYDLDGDWCVVAFLGGRIDAPFVLRWWPHARNTFDSATSGKGSDGTTLVQDQRYFKRVNGIETVVTGMGNIIVSTTQANTTVVPGGDPEKGRFARTVDEEEGGSIRINIKPSQYFELTWNPQEEGIGSVDIADDELPQSNPLKKDPQASGDRPESYVYADRDQIDFYIPATFTAVVGTDVNVSAENDVNISADNDFNVSADNNATITAGKVVELEGETIKLGEGAGADPVVLGEQLRTWLRDKCMVLSPFGPLKIDPATTATPFDPTQSTKSVVE